MEIEDGGSIDYEPADAQASSPPISFFQGAIQNTAILQPKPRVLTAFFCIVVLLIVFDAFYSLDGVALSSGICYKETFFPRANIA